MSFLYDPSYEDLVGAPEDILSDALEARALSVNPRTRRLKALCLYGWHDVLFGSFKFDDDYVTLPDGRGMSWDTWRSLPSSWRVVVACEECGRDTQHVAKGAVWVS